MLVWFGSLSEQGEFAIPMPISVTLTVVGSILLASFLFTVGNIVWFAVSSHGLHHHQRQFKLTFLYNSDEKPQSLMQGIGPFGIFALIMGIFLTTLGSLSWPVDRSSAVSKLVGGALSLLIIGVTLLVWFFARVIISYSVSMELFGVLWPDVSHIRLN